MKLLRLSAFAILCSVLISQHSSADIDQGFDWLSAQQQFDGEFTAQADIASELQATQEVLKTFEISGRESEINSATARQYLLDNFYVSSEMSSRLLLAGIEANASGGSILDALLGLVNVDGGLGLFRDSQTSPLEAGYALQAFQYYSVSTEILDAAVASLLTTQNPDGGWGLNSSSVFVTSIVVRGLSAFAAGDPAINAAINAGRSYLYTERISGPLWNSGFESAQALLALLSVVPNPLELEASRTALLDQQDADGSWSGDIYTTALALQALSLYEQRLGDPALSEGTIQGRVLVAGSVAPVVGAAVSLLEPLGFNVETNSAGQFFIDHVPQGPVTLLVEKVGFLGASRAVTVTSGELTDAGDIQLVVDPSLAMVSGRVFDDVTQTAIGGASISLTGQVQQNDLTSSSGEFDFATLVAGTYTYEIAFTGYHSVTGAISVSPGDHIHIVQGLVPAGIPLDTNPRDLTVQVLNASSLQPIPNVILELDSASTHVSNQDGVITVSNVATGPHLATLSASGYVSKETHFTIAPGSTGNLGSILLAPVVDGQPPTTITLAATVVDSLTNTPIPDAEVTVFGATNSGITDENGLAVLNDIADLRFQLLISATGYGTELFNVTVSGYGTVALTIPLSADGDPAATESNFSGVVSDGATGAAIEGAFIEIASETITSFTDINGNYQLISIPSLAFTINVTADGYFPTLLPVDLAVHGDYNFDVVLTPIAGARFSVNAVSGPANPQLPGEQLLIEAVVENLSAEFAEALIIGDIRDASGASIGTTNPYAPGTQVQVGTFNFGPAEMLDLDIPWQIGQQSPGTYAFYVNVVEPGSISRSNPLGTLLATASTTFSVAEMAAIGGSVQASPPLSQAGSQTPIQLDATVRNIGNVVIPSGDYELSIVDSTSGAIVYTGQSAAMELAVNQVAEVDFGAWMPTLAGQFDILVERLGAPEIGTLLGSILIGDIATAEYSVSPNEVPEGDQEVHASIDLTGVDVTTGVSTDPLFDLVRDALNQGGEYTGANAKTWHLTNRCLGCHIQTQSLEGMAASIDKADIDIEDTLFLLNTVATSQQPSGGLHLSHPQHAKNQTALGLWALKEWPGQQDVLLTELRGLEFLSSRAVTSGSRKWWSTDHNTGWLNNTDAITALIAQSAASIIERVDDESIAPDLSNFGVQQSWPLTTSTNVPRDIEFADGWIYVGKTAGSIDRVNVGTGAVERFVSNLAGLSYVSSLAIADDGAVYAAGQGSQLHRIETDGTVQSFGLGASDEYSDIQIDANGDVYVVSRNLNRILRVSPSGAVETFASGSILNQPYGLSRLPNGNFLVSSIGSLRILEISPSGEISVYAEGFAIPPLRMAWSPDGNLYVQTARLSSTNQTSPNGINVLRPNGTMERIGSNDGSVGLTVVGDRLFVSNHSFNALQELAMATQSMAVLSTYRNNHLPAIGEYYLSQYTINHSESLRIAFILIGLAESRKFITDPSKLAQIDGAIEFVANRLRSRQRADGGWGRFTSSSLSDPLTTAWIGIALDYTNPSPDDPIIRSTIQFLLDQQQGDGSWTNRQGYFTTRLSATSLVMTYLPMALERLGGIDVNIEVTNRPDQSYSNFVPLPDIVIDNGDSTSTYSWDLLGVTSSGQQITFDIDLFGMELDEQRPASLEADLAFLNSFTSETLVVPIAIPVVTGVSQVELDVTTDRTSYLANEDVDIQSLVTNQRVQFENGRLELRIDRLDSSLPSVQLPERPVSTLQQGESVTLGQIWNTGSRLAGEYAVVGEVYDINDRLLATDTAPFVIEITGDAIYSAILTNQVEYEAWDQVELNSSVLNPSLNHIHDATLAALEVRDPTGVLLLDIQFPVATLNIGDITFRTDYLNLVDAIEGTYSAVLTVLDANGENQLSQASTAFSVVRTPLQSLTGAVTASPQTVYLGDPVVCEDRVENISTWESSQTDVVRRLIQLDTEVVLEDTVTAIDLAPGAIDIFPRQYDSDALGLGGYSCALFASSNGEERLLGFDQFVVLPPPIDIAVSSTSGDKGRILILLDEPGYFVDELQCLFLEQAVMSILDRPIISEGDLVSVRVFDDLGNLLESESFEFDDRAHDEDAFAGEPNLSLHATKDGDFSFGLTSDVEILGTYQFTVEIVSNGQTELFDSGPITFGCDLANQFQRTFGGMRIARLEAQPVVDSDEPFGPKDAATLNFQQSYLENILSAAGWSYTIVTVAEQFVEQLRTGRYNLYGVFAEKEKLPTDFQGELKEAVFRGEGLLIAGLHDHRDSHFELPLGVNAIGKHSNALTVDIVDSPVTSVGTSPLAFGEHVMRVELSGAESAGTFTLAGGPDSADLALAYHAYGVGKSVFGAWDILVQAVQEGSGGLNERVIGDAMAYPYNPAAMTYLGAAVPIKIELANQGIAVSGQVVLTLPEGSALLDSSNMLDGSGPKYSWTYELAEADVLELVLWVTLPEIAGDLGVVVETNANGVLEEYENFAIQLESTPAENFEDVASDLNALYLADPTSYHNAQQAMGRADGYLLDQEYEFAIRELLQVAGELDLIGGEVADALHLSVSKLIRQVAIITQGASAL